MGKLFVPDDLIQQDTVGQLDDYINQRGSRVMSGRTRFSPFDDVFRKYAGDLADDDEFLKVVAAVTHAESGWDPKRVGDSGKSVGLFQIHEVHGLDYATRSDPDAASARMVPVLAAAYKTARQKGLVGDQLASETGRMAERPFDYQNPNGAAAQNYLRSYGYVNTGGGQASTPYTATPTGNALLDNPVTGTVANSAKSGVAELADYIGQRASRLGESVDQAPVLGGAKAFNTAVYGAVGGALGEAFEPGKGRLSLGPFTDPVRAMTGQVQADKETEAIRAAFTSRGLEVPENPGTATALGRIYLDADTRRMTERSLATRTYMPGQQPILEDVAKRVGQATFEGDPLTAATRAPYQAEGEAVMQLGMGAAAGALAPGAAALRGTQSLGTAARLVAATTMDPTSLLGVVPPAKKAAQEAELVLRHRSPVAGITEIDPKFFGSRGIGDIGVERESVAIDRRRLPTTAFNMEDAPLTQEEGGFGPHLYRSRVDKGQLLDISSPDAKQFIDADGGGTLNEVKMRDAGYLGYYFPQNLRAPWGGQVRMFVKTPAEYVGDVTQGTPPVAAPRTDAKLPTGTLGIVSEQPSQPGMFAPEELYPQHPELAQLKKDEELVGLKGHPGPAATPMGNLLDLAKRGEAGRHWYDEIAQLISDTGVPLRLGAAAVAVTSPEAEVSRNLRNASNILAEVYKAFGRNQDLAARGLGRSDSAFLRREDLDQIATHLEKQGKVVFGKSRTSQLDKLWQILDPDGDGIVSNVTGRKTASFFENIFNAASDMYDQNVTVDRHIMRAFGFPKPERAVGSQTAYHYVEDRIREIADALGWQPREVQAAIWTQVNEQSPSMRDIGRALRGEIEELATAVGQTPGYSGGKEPTVTFLPPQYGGKAASKNPEAMIHPFATSRAARKHDARFVDSNIASKADGDARPAPKGIKAPNPVIRNIANTYLEARGGAPIAEHAAVQADATRGRRIAEAYDALPAVDPGAREAYESFITETEAQWNALKQAGVRMEAWTKEGQPYRNSAEMREDVAKNKHLWYFTGGEPHPYMTPEQNDHFRAVHDLFGHAMHGFEFGAHGEENAWLAHSKMYSPLAAKAMTTETRGQNSWVNFGKQAEGLKPTDRPYAVQKAAILPDEFLPGGTTPTSETPSGAMGFVPGSRYYHGTSTQYDKPDPKFFQSGLYGPGYYMTDNAEVASGYAVGDMGNIAVKAKIASINGQLAGLAEIENRGPGKASEAFQNWSAPRRAQLEAERAELEQKLAGPNVRAARPPSNLKFFDIEGVVHGDEIRKISDLLLSPDHEYSGWLHGARERTNVPEYSERVYNELISEARRQYKTDTMDAKNRLSSALEQAGFDGITHAGGRMSGGTSHDVIVVFPKSLDKLQSGFGPVGTENIMPASAREPNRAMSALQSASEFGKSTLGQGIIGTGLGAVQSEEDEDPLVGAGAGLALAVGRSKALGKLNPVLMARANQALQAAQATHPTQPEQTALGRINLLRLSGMLSDTATHISNLTSNSINLGLDLATKPIQAGISRITRDQQVYLSEIPQQIVGSWAGLQSGLARAAQAVTTPLSAAQTGGTKVSETALGLQTGNKALDALGEMPLRLVAAADQLIRGVAEGAESGALIERYMRHISSLKDDPGYRAFISRSGHMSEAEQRQWLWKHLEEFPTINKLAEAKGARTVFQEGRAVTQATAAVRSAVPLLKVPLPFNNTPTNIVMQALDLTGVGYVRALKAAKEGKHVEAVEDASRAVIGTALIGAGVALAAQGVLTGPLSADPNKNRTLPSGHKQYAIRAGDDYYEINRLGPIALPLAVGATIAHSKAEFTPEEVAKWGRLMRYTMDMSTILGMYNLMNGITEPSRFGESLVEGVAGQAVPAFLREFQEVMGTNPRDPHGPIEAMLAKIPGVSEATVAPRRDPTTGEPVPQDRSGLERVLAPVRRTTGRDQPYLAALRENEVGIGPIPRQIGEGDEARDLSNAERDEMSKRMGANTQAALGQVIDTERFRNATSDMKAKILREELGVARSLASESMVRPWELEQKELGAPAKYIGVKDPQKQVQIDRAVSETRAWLQNPTQHRAPSPEHMRLGLIYGDEDMIHPMYTLWQQRQSRERNTFRKEADVPYRPGFTAPSR